MTLFYENPFAAVMESVLSWIPETLPPADCSLSALQRARPGWPWEVDECRVGVAQMGDLWVFVSNGISDTVIASAVHRGLGIEVEVYGCPTVADALDAIEVDLIQQSMGFGRVCRE